MEMTIEQKIKTLIEMHHYIRGDVHFYGYNEEDVTNALETAISIMRKYQKIKQIYKEWFSDKGHTSADAYTKIGEVLEDGQNTIKD